MATITSLDFNISSNWDGSGVRAARNDLDELQADLRRIAETRATAQVGVDIDSGDLEQVRSELNQIGEMHETATVSVHIDNTGLQQFRTELDDISHTRAVATASVNVDSSGVRQLQGELDQVNRTHATANANVNVDDAALTRVAGELRSFDANRSTAHADVNVNSADLTAVSARLREFDGRHFTAHADVDTDTAGAHLHSLGDEAMRATGALGGIAGGAGSASQGLGGVSSAGGGATGAMQALLPVLGWVALALIAIGPASALASAALLGGLGGAVIGLGALALSGTAEVKGAFASLTSSIKSEMTEAAQVMKGPLVQAMGELQSGLKQMQPAFQQAFAAAAPLIKPLADSLLNFTSSIMPGVIAALRAAGPVFDGLSAGMKGLGSGISTMFAGLAKGAAGAGAALQIFMSGTGQILGQIGVAFGQMAAAGSRALGGLMQGLSGLVGGAMKGFVGAVKAMDGSLGPFLATVGKTVGYILQQMLPVFGQILSVMMTGLIPVFKTLTPVLTQVGTALGGAIVQALRVVMPLLGSLAKTFAQVMLALAPLIPPLTKIMIAGLQLMVAVITPLLPLITLLAKGIGLLAPVINVAAIAITALSKGIQAAITWLSSWQNVTQAFSIAWNAVWNALKIATLAVWDALKVAWNATVQGLTTAWNTVSAALQAAWSTVWNAMKVVGQAIWNAMTTAWSAVVTGFTTVWNTLGNALQAAWSAVWNTMKTVAEAIWNGLTTAWSTFINTMKSVWDTVSNALKAAWEAIWTAIKGFATSTWDVLKEAWTTMLNALSAAWSTIGNALHTAWDATWTVIKGFATSTWDALKTAWTTMLNALKTAWDTIGNAIHTAWDSTWTFIKGFATSTWDAIKGAWETFLNTLKSIWNTTSGVIKKAWSDTWNAVKDTANNIWGGIKHVVATGVNDVIGIINGIIGAWDAIVNAVGLKKLNIGKITYHANFAEGGPVHGPGTGTSDDIPARLSNGEHVWTAAEVSGAGGHGAVASMRSSALGGKAVRTMGRGRGFTAAHFAAGGGVDPDTPSGATAAQKAAASVENVYLKGNEQRIGEDQYNKLPASQKAILDAAGVKKVGKGILDEIGGALSGIAHGAINGLGDIVKLGKTALGMMGKAVIHGVFDPLMKGLTGDVGAGVVGEFAVDETKNIVDGMVDLLVQTDEKYSMENVGGKIPEGMHKDIIDKALAAAGVPPPGTMAQWEAGLNTLITRESGWNAGIVNHWDSNAAAGHPSGGLAQVIGPTFAAYHVAGTSSNLLDPVANVAAAINYIVHRYGNISNVQQARASAPPKGYAKGTNNASSGIAMVGEEGPELINFGGGEQVVPNGSVGDFLSGGSGGSDLLAGANLSGDWAAAWDNAMSIESSATNSMQSDTSSFMNFMQGQFNDGTNAITGGWGKDWSDVRQDAVNSWTDTGNKANAFLADLSKQFQDNGNTITLQWAKNWEDAKSAATTSWDSTTSTGSTFTDDLKKVFTDTSTQMMTDWQKGLDGNTAQTEKYWTDTEGQFTNGSTWMTSTFFPPVNDFLTKTFPQSFTTGAANVAAGWDGLKQEVYDPVNQIVTTVYNQGIRGVWNVIANAFGAAQLDEFNMPAFATGGAVQGAGTGTSDSITARLSNGEHVWTAAEVQAAGGHGSVAAMRSSVLGGSPVRRMGSTAFATGGGVDTTQAAQGGAGNSSDPSIAQLASLTLGNIAAVANPMLDKIATTGKDTIDAMIPGTPELEKAGNGMVDGMISSVESWITANDISFTIGGVNDAAAQAWADAQVGKPYALGGNFGATFDCSQYMSGIARAILGQTPAPWFTTFAFNGASAPEGFEEGLEAPFMIGITNAGVGHTAGTLNGTNYEATPPAVRSGPGARGYNDGMFTNQYGFRPSIEASVGGVTDANHLQIIDAALAAAGVPPPGDKGSWESGLNTLITRESNWDPNAINNYDSNAAAGMPSQGLAQVIPPTFAAYHVPGTSSNILDPIANVAAAIRYIVATYGNITNVQQANPNLPPAGYRNGTKSAASGWHIVGEDGPEPVNFGGGGQSVRSFKDTLNDFREASRTDNSSGDTDNSVNFHEGAFQFNFSGGSSEECKRAMQSEEVLAKLRQAVQAGVGKKVG